MGGLAFFGFEETKGTPPILGVLVETNPTFRCEVEGIGATGRITWRCPPEGPSVKLTPIWVSLSI